VRAILCLVPYDTTDITSKERGVGDLPKVLKAHFQRRRGEKGMTSMEQSNYGLRERYDTGAADKVSRSVESAGISGVLTCRSCGRGEP
jgi:hypothetical protein